jgi:hypothetical protein
MYLYTTCTSEQVSCLCLRFLTGQTGQSKVQTGENDMVQQKITSFQTAKGGSRVDNQDPILKELTTLGTMVLKRCLFLWIFDSFFFLHRLRAFKASVVTRGRRPIIYFPFWS